jgi:hypothetical protein
MLFQICIDNYATHNDLMNGQMEHVNILIN